MTIISSNLNNYDFNNLFFTDYVMVLRKNQHLDLAINTFSTTLLILIRILDDLFFKVIPDMSMIVKIKIKRLYNFLLVKLDSPLV